MDKQKSEFLTLYHMVLADGIVHPKELETIYCIGRDTLGLSEELMNLYISQAGSVAIQPQLPEEKIATLYRLALIAWADGELDESERKLLKRYALRYGIDGSRVDELTEILLTEAQKQTKEEDLLNLLNKD